MAVLLTTTSTKIKETTVYSSGSVKAYVRTYARYISPQDKDNKQTTIAIEERFYYQNTGGAYAFDNAISKVRINTDASGTWTTVNTGRKNCSAKTEYSIQTTTRIINHNQDGTSPTITIQIYWKDTLFNTVYEDSVEITVPKMDLYPMLNVAPDFSDEDNPTITYSTELGYSEATVEAGIFDSTGNINYVPYRAVNVSNGSYTFNLTTNERNTLLQAFLGAPPYQVKYKLRTTTTNNSYTSEKVANFSIINDNAVVSYSSSENNTKVTTQVGANYYVQNASNKNFTITLQAKKYNTISSVTLIHSNQYYTVTPTTSDTGKEKTYTATIQNVPILNNTITINYQGSRSKNTTQDETFANYITYSKVDITTITINRPSPTSNDVVIENLEAVFTQTFNNISNTSVLAYKIDDGVETTIPSTEYSISDNKITLTNFLITNELPYSRDGNIRLKLTDKLTEDIENRTVRKGVPTYDEGEHDLQVNGELYIADTSRNNAVEIRDLIYPIGSIYISVTDDTAQKVQNRFGGTWEAFATGKTLVGIDTTDTNFDTIEETGGSKTHQHNTALFSKSSTGAGGNVLVNWNGSQYGLGTGESVAYGARGEITTSGKSGSTTGYPYKTSSDSSLQPYVVVYMWKRTA